MPRDSVTERPYANQTRPAAHIMANHQDLQLQACDTNAMTKIIAIVKEVDSDGLKGETENNKARLLEVSRIVAGKTLPLASNLTIRVTPGCLARHDQLGIPPRVAQVDDCRCRDLADHEESPVSPIIRGPSGCLSGNKSLVSLDGHLADNSGRQRYRRSDLGIAQRGREEVFDRTA
jgi:hypothetical protein